MLPGILALGTSVASAQEPAPPAHVAYVEGRAVLEHDTTSEDVEPNLPLETGDRLRTTQGRVEVLFGDGSILQLDEETTVDLLSDSLVRELAGRVAIIAGSSRAGRLQIDTPAGSVRITSPGEFRVSVFDEGGAPEVEVAVIRGSADLFTDRGTVSIGAGARALARQGDAPSQPMSFNSASWDAFDRWSQERLSLRRGAASSHYVPPPLRPYGAVLDTYGSWNYEPAYGYVWFPHVVSGWRPYYQGRWRFYARFGWTWVGGDAWGWPTHHYGRWGTTSAGAWFWAPGSTWGPAWVHWAVSPGYVSWCALGFDGRPVVPFGHAYAGHSYNRHDPWGAWTVVPRGQFGARGPVTRVAVDGRRFGPDGVRPFVVQATPPSRPYAVARESAIAGGRMPIPVGAPAVGETALRGPANAAGQSGSREWGRDLRWSTRQPGESPAAVPRGSAPASPGSSGSVAQSWRRDDGSSVREPAAAGTTVGQGAARSAGHSAGHYGTAIPRRPPTDASAPAVDRANRPTRPWSSDSVPVYRGGILETPSDGAGAPRAYERGSMSASPRPARPGTPVPPTASDPTQAVRRGTSPAYVSPRGSESPAYQPPYQPRGDEPRRYSSPATQPPAYAAPPASAPPPGRAPSAEPRQAPPDHGGSGTAVPRGGAESRGRAEAPQGSAPGAVPRSGHHR